MGGGREVKYGWVENAKQPLIQKPPLAICQHNQIEYAFQFGSSNFFWLVSTITNHSTTYMDVVRVNFNLGQDIAVNLSQSAVELDIETMWDKRICWLTGMSHRTMMPIGFSTCTPILIIIHLGHVTDFKLKTTNLLNQYILTLMHLSKWILGGTRQAIHRIMTGVRLTIHGTLTTAVLSDITLTSFWHYKW